jgi:uncharacterized protein YbaA (DUF1428 family)
MSNPTEVAARSYIAAWNEPDAAARARLLEACWAVDARLVTGGDGYPGRAALDAAMARFVADPRRPAAVLTSPIDVQGRMFRFRGVARCADGTVLGESFDAGEVDADGRIAILLTFVGPLPER